MNNYKELLEDDDPFDNRITRDRPFPVDPQPDPEPLWKKNPWRRNQSQIVRNNEKFSYQCPECDGKFVTWEQDNPVVGEDKERCPFCHTAKGEYGDDTINDLREEKERLEGRVEELEDRLEEIKDALE